MANLTKGYFDQQLKKLATRENIKALDTRIDALDTKVDTLDTGIDALGTGIDALGTRMDVLDTKVDTLDTRIDALDTKIDTLDTKIDQRVDDLAGMVARRFDPSTSSGSPRGIRVGDDLERKLDVKADVDQLKTQMKRVWDALAL